MRTKSTGLSLLLLLSGAALLAAPFSVLSADRPLRLCVLNKTSLVQNSRLAKNMGMHFQQIRQQAQGKLESERRTLEADARALEGVRQSVAPAVVKTREAEIARRRVEFKERGEQINRDLASLDEQLTENVVKAAEPTIRAVEAERGCSMLMERGALLNLRDSLLDITPTVIERINVAQPSPTSSGR